MATGSLGSLVISLEANTAKLESDLGKAGYLLQKQAQEMSVKTIAIGTAIGTQIGHFATEVIEKIAEIIPATIERMDQLSKAAEKVGLPTDEFTKLNYAAGLADVATESLEKSLGKLIKSEGAAFNATSQQAKIFDALGVSIKNADGSLRPASDVLAQFADRFKSLKGSPESIAAGMAIFGRNFQEIIPLLNQGSAGIKEAADEAERFHITLSESTGKAAEEANDNVKRLHAVFDGLKQQVVADLLPQLNQLLTWAINFTSNGANAADAARDIGKGFTEMAQAAQSIGQIVDMLERLHNLLADSDKFSLSLDVPHGGSALGNYLKEKFPALYSNADLGITDKDQAANDGSFIVPSQLQIPGLNQPSFSAVPTGVDYSSYVNQAKLQAALANKPAPNAHAMDAQIRAAQDFQLALKTLADEMNGPLGKAEADHAKRLLQLEQLAKRGKVSAEDLAKAKALEGQSYAKTTDEIKRQFEIEIAGLSGPIAQEQSEHEDRLHQINQIAKDYGLSTSRLNALLAEEAKQHNIAAVAAKRQADPMATLMADMQTEIDLVGKSSSEQAVYNELIREGKSVTDAYAQSLFAEARMHDTVLANAQKNIQFMDTFRSDLVDLGITALHNFGQVGQSFKKMMDDIGVQIERRILENWISDLFGQQGSTGQGTQGGGILGSLLGGLFGSGNGNANGYTDSAGAGANDGSFNANYGNSGSGWSGIISSIFGMFGGGHADGGSTTRGRFYEVGELDRPEMYSQGGRSYLLPGNNGNVTPIRGGGFTQVNNINYAAPYDAKTEDQKNKRLANETRRAQARN